LGGYATDISDNGNTSMSERIATAKKLLEKNFTLKNKDGKNILTNTKTKKPVQVKLAILESVEFKSIAKQIELNLSLLGIDVVTTSYEENELVGNIIRDRNFEILLFGYQTDIINPDMYYFFHSSQTSDPGMNIAGFANTEADKLILELRKNIPQEDREEKLEKLEKLIISDYSYIPLYSPDFIYIMDSRIKNFSKKALHSREERFDSIAN